MTPAKIAPRAQARNADQMVELLKQAATRQLILNGFAGLSIPVSYTHLTLPTIYSV